MVEVSALLKVHEVAHILHVHPNTIRLWTNRGLLKTFRIGPRGDRRFLMSDLEEFIGHNGAVLGLDLRLLEEADDGRSNGNNHFSIRQFI